MGRKKRVKSLSLKTSKSDEVNGVEENDEEKAEDPSRADASMASSSSHEHLEKYFDERRRYSTSSQEDEDDYYDTDNLLPMDIQQMILGDGDVSKVTINQEYPEEEEVEKEEEKSDSVETPLSPDIYDEILETFQVKKSPNVKCYSPKKLNTETGPAPVKQTEEMMKDLKITPPVEESGSESFKILKNVLMEMVSETKTVQYVEEVEKMELDLPPVSQQSEIDLPKEETPKEVIKTPKKQAKKTEKKVKETKKTEPKKVKSKEPKEPKKPKESKKKETKTTPKPKDVEKMSKKAIKDALKMAENRKKLPPKERFKFPERKLFAKENVVVNGEEKPEEKTETKPEVRRRSNRIRANRWEDLSEVVLPPPSLPPPPVPTIPNLPVSTSTPPPPYFDSDKPVKVKSRWRRTSELEMGAGLTSDSDASVSSISALSVKSESQNSPMEIMAPPKLPLVTVHPEIEERLKSFECITANIFLLPRRKNKELNDMQCDCELTKEIVKGEKKGCGTDCLNRMLQIECGPSCSLGNLCTNKLIQNCQNSKLEVVKTMKKGLGLVASANTETGAFLMEYVGEVIDPKEFKKRAKEYSKEKSRHFYFMALDSDSVIDATQKGNISRFINHSCDPNSETQQWLVGGKRRIGFFSVKPISKGEEITFDYKFQRYGKEAQRCYCESSNCRGWIGEEPDDEEDEEEEEDEDEEEEEEEVKPETEDAKVKEIEESKPPDQETITVVQTENIEKEKEKKEKKKKEKRKDIVEFITEPDLDEEISKLSSTGMKNQAQTLKMSRLMLRAENVESKCRLLDIVLASERACLRLFLDYRGLTLLYSWMSGSKTSNNLKIKALKTLEILPITNKTILKDSKVIDVVKDWTYPGAHKEPTKEKAGEDSNSKSPDSVETLKTESGNSQDSQSLDATLADEKSSMIVELSKTLISKWADLKEEFRIPKKQRFEQMKEHEREANRGYVDPRDENKATYESRGGVGYRHWPNEKDRNKEKERRNRGRESPESREHRYREKNGLIGGLKLTKVQRRELFELQVKEEEKQRKKQLEEVNEMWLNHKEKCAALGVDPAKTPLYYHNDGFPVLYQPQTGTWVPIPPDAAVENDPVFRHRVAGNPMIGPLMPHGFPPPATPPPGFVPQLGAPPFREIMPPGTPTHGAPPFREIMPGTPNIGVPPFREIVAPGTPNHVVPPYRDILPQGTPTQINIPTVMGRPPGVNVPPSPYHQVPPQFNQPPPPLPLASIPYQTPPNPVYPYMQQSPLDNMTPSKAPVVINPTSVQPPPSSIPPPPRKLPPGWKKAKDKEGRFYFYHGKIRKSQWNFPTEQEIAAALAWTSQITANDESESDDDDSDSDDDDDSSSEEEEEKDLSPPFKEEEEDEEEEEAAEKRKVEEDLPILPGLEPEISPINNQENNEPVLKKRREGLVQVNIISPRDEDENYRKGIKKSKIRETKEKLARAKQRHKKEKMKKAKRCEADTSSDRRIKEQFRVEMAKFVIIQLNPYRKTDCNIGRIETTSDFKHLARKLTHFVMLKELRHLPSVEGLVCNDNVKHKAKDFIKKYMAKFGPVYTRGPEEVNN